MLKLAEQGLNYTQIARQVGIPRTSVFRYIKNAQLERHSRVARPGPKPLVANTAAPRDIAGVLILERVPDSPPPLGENLQRT